MKRSDLIRKLDQYFKDSTDFMTGEMYVDGEDILEFLEKLEVIRPPARWRPHDWNQRGITYSQWIQEPSKIYEWEPEDGR